LLTRLQNWFQNRRAKSKQDAKKQAGQITMMQNGQQMDAQDIDPSFLSQESLPLNDSPLNIDTAHLSNGLGISHDPTQAQGQMQDQMAHQMQQHHQHMQVQQGHERHLSLQHIRPQKAGQEGEGHRRTLTQEEFDAFTHSRAFVPGVTGEETLVQSPAIANGNNDMLDDYFPELCDLLGFENNDSNEHFTSEAMQPAFSADSYATTASGFSDAVSTAPSSVNPSGSGPASEWSNHSPPALSITPAAQHESPVDLAGNVDVSPRAKSNSAPSNQWQPGQSVPVDFAQMEREFRLQAALRGGDHSHLRSQSVPFVEQPLAFPDDEAYGNSRRQDSGSVQLTQGIGNLGIGNDDDAQSGAVSNFSGSIAARRQRPRPVPLGAASLRSTSYSGTLPKSPGAPSNQSLDPNVNHKTLRRIKSSNVMNGIANGRIQKNSGPQRSPLNFTFADALNNQSARRVSSYSPSGRSMTVNLAPPPHSPLAAKSPPDWTCLAIGRRGPRALVTLAVSPASVSRSTRPGS